MGKDRSAKQHRHATLNNVNVHTYYVSKKGRLSVCGGGPLTIASPHCVRAKNIPPLPWDNGIGIDDSGTDQCGATESSPQVQQIFEMVRRGREGRAGMRCVALKKVRNLTVPSKPRLVLMAPSSFGNYIAGQEREMASTINELIWNKGRGGHCSGLCACNKEALNSSGNAPLDTSSNPRQSDFVDLSPTHMPTRLDCEARCLDRHRFTPLHNVKV